MEYRKRPKQIKARVNDEEYAIISNNAKLSNLTINQYLKKISIEGEIHVQDLKTIRSLIKEINSIGQNINQIARYVNGIGGANKSDLTSIKKQVDSIWLLLKSSLLEQDYQRL